MEEEAKKPGGGARVGIYWMYQKKLFHVASEPVDEGLRTTISVDGHFGHYQLWPVMARQGVLDALPEDLRDEYDYIDRGRVIYVFARESYVIYHGSDFDEEDRQKIVEAFCLEGETVVDEVDEHYNPLPEDFLF